uniref:Uncharacterized protein n=1 Tax=Arion vulgaris TaxID=1028688 RepID=A0A0B6YZA1_9EUPU
MLFISLGLRNPVQNYRSSFDLHSHAGDSFLKVMLCSARILPCNPELHFSPCITD